MQENATTRHGRKSSLATSVIAAVSGDAAAEAVLSTAIALGALLGADVEALHVGRESAALRESARRAGVPIETIQGPTVQTLADAVEHEEVVATVIGARGKRTGKRPAGSTALALITLHRCPVVVVPPGAHVRDRIASILVPLNGTPTSASALENIVALAHAQALRIVVAHVYREDSLPAFSDHLPHEVQAWSDEFIARNCPPATDASLETRVGEPYEQVLDILQHTGCDLVALGWHGRMHDGHAAVVRQMLAHSPVPVLLTPVRTGSPRGETPASEPVLVGSSSGASPP